MNIIHTHSKKESGDASYGIFKYHIRKILESKKKVVVAFPGGRSIIPVLKAITEKAASKQDVDEQIPWQHLHIFMVDERLVPIDHKDSNFKFVKDNLINKIPIPEENVHPFIYDKDNIQKNLDSYKAELDSYGGKFDIVFLGVGEDGHIAALFPEHHSFSDNSKGVIAIHDSPKPPPERMSSSRKLIEKADTAIALFSGEAKKEAYTAFLDKKITEKQLPVKLLYHIQNSYIITMFEAG